MAIIIILRQLIWPRVLEVRQIDNLIQTDRQVQTDRQINCMDAPPPLCRCLGNLMFLEERLLHNGRTR